MSRSRPLIAALAGAIVAAVAAAAPASAAFSNVSFTATNDQASASSTYTWVFKVGAADTAFDIALPSSVGGVASSSISIQTSADGVTFNTPTLGTALAPTSTLTGVNLATPLTVGTTVRITVSGLTNPSATGPVTLTVNGFLTSLTSLVGTIVNTVAETVGSVLTVVAQTVGNAISTNLSVAPSSTITFPSSSHSYSVDPATSPTASASDTITVATNAASYALQAVASSDLIRAGTSGSSASDRIDNSTSASGPHFGYTVTVPGGSPSALSAFGTSYSALTGASALTGLTNSAVTTITYSLRTDYTKSPGLYTNTVTYRLVPTY